MRNPKIITLCVIACMLILSACSNTSDNQEKIVEKASDMESTQLKLDRNDITVEVGESFVVSASYVGDVVKPVADFQWQLEYGIIDYKNVDWAKWTPDKVIVWKELVTDINPLKGTEFIAREPGAAELCVLDSNSNIISDICKVTVVEKKLADEDNETEEVINENKSNSSVLYSKNGTTILLKNNLPATVSYAIGGEIDSSCEILNVSVGDVSFMGVAIDIEYKKTFDSNEMGGEYAFWWKLYDSSNTVIEDGPVTQYNASVGEKFKDSFRIYEDLGAETYTLEFVDFK